MLIFSPVPFYSHVGSKSTVFWHSFYFCKQKKVTALVHYYMLIFDKNSKNNEWSVNRCRSHGLIRRHSGCLFFIIISLLFHAFISCRSCEASSVLMACSRLRNLFYLELTYQKELYCLTIVQLTALHLVFSKVLYKMADLTYTNVTFFTWETKCPIWPTLCRYFSHKYTKGTKNWRVSNTARETTRFPLIFGTWHFRASSLCAELHQVIFLNLSISEA